MTNCYSKEVAEDLLTIGAVKFSPTDPFTWASGIMSPIYTDNRMTIGYPQIRSNIADGLVDLITKNFAEVDIIAGVATAGIPHAALVADRLQKPMIYVRAKAKDHGAGQQIEGAEVQDKKVILIDDLISTGGSVLKAAKAVQAAGGQVLGVVAIFSYELPVGEQNFASVHLTFKSLTTYSQLIQAALTHGDLDASQIAALRQWRQDPAAWRA